MLYCQSLFIEQLCAQHSVIPLGVIGQIITRFLCPKKLQSNTENSKMPAGYRYKEANINSWKRGVNKDT